MRTNEDAEIELNASDSDSESALRMTFDDDCQTHFYAGALLLDLDAL